MFSFLKRKAPAAGDAESVPDENQDGFFSRLRKGLSKTRGNLTEGLADLVLGKRQIDDEILEELETRLLLADLGVDATQEIIGELNGLVSRKQVGDADALFEALRKSMINMLTPCEAPLDTSSGPSPFVILTVGVNGAGKTTTIGKLTRLLLDEGKSVALAAGDTFRAAAVEQLQVWGERNSVPVIAQQTGADSASVIFDAVAAAQARNINVLLADTAGRLHTKSNLMEELKKIKRVMGKLDETAPHEVLLVLDATTGQNALNQARQFHEAVGVTGLVITKLDGTAKGGIIFAISRALNLPVRFIGVGESVEDMRPFSAESFVDALLDHIPESEA